MSVYSDFTQKTYLFKANEITGSKFKAQNEEILKFSEENYKFPCENEIVLLLQTVRALDSFEVFNMIRIDCSEALLGYSQ